MLNEKVVQDFIHQLGPKEEYDDILQGATNIQGQISDLVQK